MTQVAHGHIELAQTVVNRIASEPIKNHLMRLRVVKAKKALTDVLEDYLEVKNELIREYGTEVAEGVQIDPKQENFAEFTAKYDELTNSEAAVNLDSFPDALLSLFDLSADDIEILMMVGLVKDGDESEAS